MLCPRCGFENREDARFCKRCGQSLQPAPSAAPKLCPVCGATLKSDARFCARCGQPFVETPAKASAPPKSPPAPSPVYGGQAASSMPAPPPAYNVPAGMPAPAVAPVAMPSNAGRYEQSIEAPERTTGGASRLILTLIALGLIACLSCCGVVALAVLPSMSAETPVVIRGDPTGHDISIWVRESYINKNLTAILPDQGLKDAYLDVQLDNHLVVAANFEVFSLPVGLEVTARMSVVNGEIEIVVESVESGGQNLMEFLGLTQVTLGENFTRALKEQLENELGEGSELLDISTDDNHIILWARL